MLSQRELQRLSALTRSSSPLSRFAKMRVDQSPDAGCQFRPRFARNAGGTQTAPTSPEAHKEEAEDVAAAGSPSQTAAVVQERRSRTADRNNDPVLMHVADYVSSDCADSDDLHRSSSSVAGAPADDRGRDDDEPFPVSSEDGLPDRTTRDANANGGTAGAASAASAAGVHVAASKSDGHICSRRCEAFDASSSSLDRRTACWSVPFKAHSKSSRKKSQSHSCRLI